MKKRFTYLAIALMAVACSKARPETVRYGEISVALGEPEAEVVMKAAVELDKTSEEAKRYVVTVYEKSAGESMFSSTYYDFEKAVLPVGNTYYVVAETCTEAASEEGNGQMRIAGVSADVELTPEEMSREVSIACSVANGKISVLFDPSVEGRFEGLQVVLGRTSPARSLTITSDTDTWFNPSSVSYTITGRFNAGGISRDVSMTGTIDLKAKTHVKLVVKVDLSNGQMLIPSVTVDDTLESTDLPETFNPYE